MWCGLNDASAARPWPCRPPPSSPLFQLCTSAAPAPAPPSYPLQEAALIFGQPAAALVGEHVQKVRGQRWRREAGGHPLLARTLCRHPPKPPLPPVPPWPHPQILPRVCPGGKTSELLVARGQRGGAKRSIGAVVAAEGLHPDGRPLHVSLQAAESTERPGRWV